MANVRKSAVEQYMVTWCEGKLDGRKLGARDVQKQLSLRRYAVFEMAERMNGIHYASALAP